MKTSARSLLFLSLLLLSAFAASAGIFPVNDVPTLKAAITAANLNGQDDTIEMAAGVYTLTARDSFLNGLPLVGADGGHQLIIHGNGATIQRIPAIDDAAHRFRILQTDSGANLTLSGLTLTNGNPGGFHGGAIYNNASESSNSTLTIINCTISGNSGDYGGAIFNDGSGGAAATATLTVMNSTISGNHASQHGGGIWNESGGIVMNVSNSTFSANTSSGSAGAVQFDGSNGTATGSIRNCTFTQNSATSEGGGVNVDGFSGSAILTVDTCTFDRNTAAHGGGVALDGSSGMASVTVSNCTLSGNSASVLGGGIYISQSGGGSTGLHIGNTILKTGASGANLVIDGGGFVGSNGYNLSSDAAGGSVSTGPGGLLDNTGDIRNTDPLLDPAGLKDNGGLTKTIALQFNSPAIDQGKATTAGTSSNDQRGEPRPFNDPLVAPAAGGDSTDIGAYEADVRVISEVRNVNDLIMTFTTVLGRTYELQSRPDLLPATPWTIVGSSIPAPPVTGTGGIIQMTAPNAIGSGPGFYRAHQL